MPGGRGTKVRLWRWRSSPLRRRDDKLEAWIVLVMWAVIAVGGTIAGLVTAHSAHEALAQQRSERHAVRAVVLTDIPRSPSSREGGTYRTLAKVRWTTPDGVTRTGRTLVDDTGLRRGSTITAWQDTHGALTPEPADPAEAAAEAVFFGVAAALALSGLALGAGALARWRLDQRRLDQWSREWDLIGPQWSQKTG